MIGDGIGAGGQGVRIGGRLPNRGLELGELVELLVQDLDERVGGVVGQVLGGGDAHQAVLGRDVFSVEVRQRSGGKVHHRQIGSLQGLPAHRQPAQLVSARKLLHRCGRLETRSPGDRGVDPPLAGKPEDVGVGRIDPIEVLHVVDSVGVDEDPVGRIVDVGIRADTDPLALEILEGLDAGVLARDDVIDEVEEAGKIAQLRVGLLLGKASGSVPGILQGHRGDGEHADVDLLAAQQAGVLHAARGHRVLELTVRPRLGQDLLHGGAEHEEVPADRGRADGEAVDLLSRGGRRGDRQRTREAHRQHRCPAEVTCNAHGLFPPYQ